MINFIIWIAVGGLVGWLASVVMKNNASQGILADVLVGIVGSFLAGYLVTPFVGGATINQGDFSLSGLVVSFLGAAILLAIVGLFRRRTAHI